MEINLKGNVIIRHQAVPDCEWCDKAKALLDEKHAVRNGSLLGAMIVLGAIEKNEGMV